MKKFLLVLAVIGLLLAFVSQGFAGYTIKNRGITITGSGQIFTGSKIVKAIVYFSSVAGDHAGIYQADASTGPITSAELEFELGITANNSNAYLYFGEEGINLSNLYVGSSSSTAITTVVYDY
jgi:hypothetical protein